MLHAARASVGLVLERLGLDLDLDPDRVRAPPGLALGLGVAALAGAAAYTLKRVAWDDRPLPPHHVLPRDWFDAAKRGPRTFLITGSASGASRPVTLIVT